MAIKEGKRPRTMESKKYCEKRTRKQRERGEEGGKVRRRTHLGRHGKMSSYESHGAYINHKEMTNASVTQKSPAPGPAGFWNYTSL